MDDASAGPGDEGEPALVPGSGLRGPLGRLERLLAPEVRLVRRVGHAEQDHLAPAWRRVTQGEPRWQVSLAIVAAVVLQLSLPDRLTFASRWPLPIAEVLVLVLLLASNPSRIDRVSPVLRVTTILLVATASLANAWSAGALVVGIIHGHEGRDPSSLLLNGAAVWATNVLVFSLWYWELDRQGPAARANALQPHPDFLFPQMSSPELAPHDWEPAFVDYLFLSFTNATAFSPTDVLPLSRWAKLLMMLQSAVSLATVGLVVARAVNILPQ